MSRSKGKIDMTEEITEEQERYLQEFEHNLLLLASDGATPPTREVMLAYLRNDPSEETNANNLQSWAASNARSGNWMGILVIEAAITFTDESQSDEMRGVGDHSIFR